MAVYPSTTLSEEPRVVEFELTSPATGSPGMVKVPGYTLYYVCEDVNGVCMYRRQDVEIPVRVVSQHEDE